MDPVACLNLAESAMHDGDRDEVGYHLANLAEWVRGGGFMDEGALDVWNESMMARWDTLQEWLFGPTS